MMITSKQSKKGSMKSYLIIIAVICFSSCLKESIPDAMLVKHSVDTRATLSYKIYDNPINISVDDAHNGGYNSYTLGYSQNTGYYSFRGISDSAEIYLYFYTDSLRTGNYKYISAYGDKVFVSYDYDYAYGVVHAFPDSMSINITSINNGRISGNFSGALSPLSTINNPFNEFGPPASMLITNGTFENVPFFY